MYGTILVAISGTSDSAAVLRHTAQIARSTGSAVRVLHVRPIDTSDVTATGATPTAVSVVEEDAGKAYDTVAEAVDMLTGAGISAHGEISEAMRQDVARTVWTRAEELNAGLVVLGLHQRGFLASLLGNVGDQVARHSSCPVLLVP